MPSRLFYINQVPGRVSQAVELRQSGKCRYCGKNFTADELIVSNGKRKKYYHKECAQTLNILILLPEELANKAKTKFSMTRLQTSAGSRMVENERL